MLPKPFCIKIWLLILLYRFKGFISIVKFDFSIFLQGIVLRTKKGIH
ncbi:hypothetical protein BTJ45_02331 [Bacillus mycoides]|nr:hypothetical protein BTJ45_02331 [Bacillus mycoides]